MRAHAVHQAAIVWALTGELRPEQLAAFIETGQMDHATRERIPYDPTILAELQTRLDHGQPSRH